MTTSTHVVRPSITEYAEESQALSWTDASGGTAFCNYSLDTPAQQTAQEVVAAQPFEIDLTPNLDTKTIVPSSVSFSWGGDRYVDRLGKLYKNPKPATGVGVEAGSIDYTTGKVQLNNYDSGDNTITIHSLLSRSGRQFITYGVFRTPGAPLRPGSLTIQGAAADGTAITVTAAFDGTIDEPGVQGYINVDTGVGWLAFGDYVTAAGNESEPWYSEDTLDGAGNVWKPNPVFADTFTYTCVVYSYIPLDADLIGLDPVRLPTDGRVPIVRSGNVAVIHNTQTLQLAPGLAAGQEITFSRPGINSVRLYDAEGVYVPTTYYSFDEDTQILTMADPLDLSGFTEPLIANHRVEDMALVNDVQINGQLNLARGVSHDYPTEGTYVSSAMLYGDLQARVYNLFDQKTWSNDWSDDLVGDAATGTYNDLDFPPIITNKGAVKERWALVFDDAGSHVQVIGEKYGVVHDSYISQDIEPINPATGQPFWKLAYEGWGAGWSNNNVLRFNTEAADGGFWIARTTLQGPETEPYDEFTIQPRGDSE